MLFFLLCAEYNLAKSLKILDSKKASEAKNPYFINAKGETPMTLVLKINKLHEFSRISGSIDHHRRKKEKKQSQTIQNLNKLVKDQI